MRWTTALFLALLLSLGFRAGGAQDVAPAAGVGTVAGRIVDEGTGQPITDAGVEAVGTGKRVRTDIDGRYSIELPAGTHELRVFAPLYRGMRVQSVLIRPGQVSRVDAALTSTGQAGIEVVEVVAQAKKATEAAQLAERKGAGVVKDTISREAMRKSTGSDAAALVKRAPSVTVRDDKFVFVRGLGERYTSALLNQNRLPSPDPLRRAVPLDLFPADFLDALAVVKTYSPELPGDFSGGLIELTLRDFPEKLEYSLGVSTTFNTQATGDDYLTYRGAPGDYVTMGVPFRNPPASLPPFPVSQLPNQRRFAVGRSFKDIWSPYESVAPPGFGANFAVGNVIGPFGFQLGGVYSNEYKAVRNAILRQFVNVEGSDGSGATLEETSDFRSESGIFQAKIGGVLTGAYKISDRQQLFVRALVYRNAIDEATRDIGTYSGLGDGEIARNTALRYVADQLSLGQIAGEHDLGWIRADWRTLLARTKRDEPDSRYLTYQGPPGDLKFANETLSGQRLTNTTIENSIDNMLDLTVPFAVEQLGKRWGGPGKFRFGPAYAYRRRDYEQRRFSFSPNQGTQDFRDPAEELFAPDQIGVGLADFTEPVVPGDDFRATQEIIGGYGLFELPIVRNQLRVIGGSRLEYSLIRLNTTVRNDVAAKPPTCGPGTDDVSICDKLFTLKNIDPLPAVNLIYSPLSDMNFRFSWAKTVARPEFRELAPAQFPAQRGRRAQFGNPDLVESEITSFDLRWEWFFSPLELVSFSLFKKSITNPIEQVTVPFGGGLTDTWINAESADLKGFEFEGRKDFGFLADRLSALSVSANASYIDAEVFVPRVRIFGLESQQTSTNRQLQGQAPFIINAALEWSDPELFTARLLYFTTGPTITSAGSAGVPDTFLERRDQIDAVVTLPLTRWVGSPVNARLTVENILNGPFVFTVADRIQRKFTSGVKMGVSFSYTF